MLALVVAPKAKAKAKAKTKAKAKPMTVRRILPAPMVYPVLVAHPGRMRPMQADQFGVEVMRQLSRICLITPTYQPRLLALETGDVDATIYGVLNALIAVLRSGRGVQLSHRLGTVTITPNTTHNVSFVMSEPLRRFVFLRSRDAA